MADENSEEKITPPKPRLRIVSNGTGAGTRLYIVKEDGTEEDVTSTMHAVSVEWKASGHQMATAIIECRRVEVNVIGKLESPIDEPYKAE